MAVNDVYLIRLYFTLPLDPEPAIMRFFYRVLASTGSDSAQDAVAAASTDLYNQFAAVQHSQCFLTRIDAINLMDVDDSHVSTYNEPGDIASPPAANFLAIALRKRPGGLGTRYSYKRVPGVIRSGCDAYGLNETANPAYTAALNALAVNLGNVLEVADGSYYPVQVTWDGTYGHPVTNIKSLQGAWEINSHVSHQDTRQIYRWGSAVADMSP